MPKKIGRTRALKQALQSLLADAENFEIHIGNARANMIRKALGLSEVIYDQQYKALLNSKQPLLG